ncbi:MAG: hypothetical protein PHD32_09815 [Eubacteriales bacterium]|nr:hypothetical protein [Eubacteriales bacterium]
MGMGAMKQHRTKAAKKWTLEEIYEILKNEAADELPGELSLSGSGLMKGVFVKGVGKYDVSITVMGSSIICGEYVRKDEQAKSIGLSFLTSGWSDIADKDSLENAKVTEAVGKIVDKLFIGRT